MEHRQLTLMFTDIVGYSRLMGQNERQTIELLGEYRRILLAQIENYGGTVIEFIGDAVFASFVTPTAAVNAGIAIQEDLGTFNRHSAPSLPKLQSRIGIHTGEVAMQNGALFGDDVNIAARLEPIAVAESLCISEGVYTAVRHQLAAPVLALGLQPLKNIESKVRAYLVRPSGITVGTQAHYLLRKVKQKINAYRYPLAACLLALVTAGFYFIPRWLVPGYNANYVEIADFKNLMSEDGGPDYFSAGITEALRSQLADIRDVYILRADQGVRGPLRLEGSVQRIGESLRIAYQLFRRRDNAQIAGGKLDASYQDIFILQDRVVGEIARYLAQEFGLQNFRPAALKLTADTTAYDFYLRGLAFLRRPQSHENFDEAIKLLSTALVHDRNFALANAGLCRAYRGKYKLTRNAAWTTRAEEFCQLARQQDDSLSEVYESLGSIYRETGREEEAVAILQQAIEIDDANVDALIELATVYKRQKKLELAESTFAQVIAMQPEYWRGHHELATFYFHQSRLPEAVTSYTKVLAITPENAIGLSNLGVAYFYLADYKSAAQALEKSVALSPSSWSYSNTGTMYYFSGDYEKAADMFRQAIKLAPEDFRWHVNLADALRQIPDQTEKAKTHYQKTIELASQGLAVNDKDATLHQYLAVGHLFSGQRDIAGDHLNQALKLSPKNIDILYTSVKFWSVLEQFDKAMDALAVLVEAGYSPDLIKADPDLKSLRRHPRYRKIVFAKN